ncbi:hypothetical protein PYCCODRAFT_714820 [Trametes coccinea BRFM310]|uniref:Uncharacterized protein n=1 Tax=Trametes coccinea (strain BRFM310) TaxID=1353009 RepID=A0A1Y2IG84_TRAC3|nr:hypothetical protein PYCCODRAFT_714820 [Trametes coccinea BRFM310]
MERAQPCQHCDCPQYFPMPRNQLQQTGEPECACTHAVEDHRSATPVPTRFCENGTHYQPAVGEDPSNPRAICRCGQPYFLHRLQPSTQNVRTGPASGGRRSASDTLPEGVPHVRFL